MRQSVYSRIADCEDVNDAERRSQHPTFRLIGSEKTWERGAALTSRLQTFETGMLAEDENFGRLVKPEKAERPSRNCRAGLQEKKVSFNGSKPRPLWYTAVGRQAKREIAGKELFKLMGRVGLLELVVILGVAVIFLLPFYKIFSRAGHSGALCLLMAVPVLNLALLYYLAFGEWPVLRELEALRRRTSN